MELALPEVRLSLIANFPPRVPESSAGNDVFRSRTSLPAGLPAPTELEYHRLLPQRHFDELSPVFDSQRLRQSLSVAVNPRREIKGGFPESQDSAVFGHVAKSADPTSSTADPTDRPSEASPPARPMSAGIPEDEVTDAIQKLIEQTSFPMPRPGLEIRVIRQPEHGSENQREERETREERVPAQQPAASAPAPALDVNAIAEKVYQALLHRQQLERERKGLY
jgi:hypothetical protein